MNNVPWILGVIALGFTIYHAATSGKFPLWPAVLLLAIALVVPLAARADPIVVAAPSADCQRDDKGRCEYRPKCSPLRPCRPRNPGSVIAFRE